ncbi:MAG: serine hydrolase [bacterium]|nr:serine hydrolase [bacterium]
MRQVRSILVRWAWVSLAIVCGIIPAFLVARASEVVLGISSRESRVTEARGEDGDPEALQFGSKKDTTPEGSAYANDTNSSIPALTVDFIERIEERLPHVRDPKVTAETYGVYELEGGARILESESFRVVPIASLTKILTAIVAVEEMNLDDTVTVSDSAIATYGTTGGLRIGERLRLHELMYPLLMESSNDAAEAIAEHFGRTRFLIAMNTRAHEIGAMRTRLVDPSGLSDKNVSSADDVAALVTYFALHHPELFRVTTLKEHKVRGHIWRNGSPLLALPGYGGGKNGYTDEAKSTAAAIFRVSLEDGRERTLIVVVLRSTKRADDVGTLLAAAAVRLKEE